MIEKGAAVRAVRTGPLNLVPSCDEFMPAMHADRAYCRQCREIRNQIRSFPTSFPYLAERAVGALGR